jgi:hypothetical protein
MQLVRKHRRNGCSLEDALQCARDDMQGKYGASPDWASIIQMIADVVLKLIEGCDTEDLAALEEADLATEKAAPRPGVIA